MDTGAGDGCGTDWDDLEGSDDGEEVYLDDFLPPTEVIIELSRPNLLFL